MSHLTTIIGRVESKLEAYKDNRNALKYDRIFLQAVKNLMEYQDCWKDSTVEEQKKADELFWEYKDILIGTGYEYPEK